MTSHISLSRNQTHQWSSLGKSSNETRSDIESEYTSKLKVSSMGLAVTLAVRQLRLHRRGEMRRQQCVIPHWKSNQGPIGAV